MASFDENGKYIKTNWKAGDKITATKLNKIEESIEAVNDNDISRHVEADARLDALEAKDVAHDKELTKIKNTIADNKAAAELGDYDINSRMTFLEEELNEGIEEVHNVAETVDGKIAAAEANMTAQVDQGKADMEAMVAEVEGELDGINSQLKHKVSYPILNGEIGVINLIYEYGDIRRYGANNSIEQDTEAIKNAIASMYALKDSVKIPRGIWYLTESIIITDNITIQGVGGERENNSNSIITKTGGFDGFVIKKTSYLKNFCLNCNDGEEEGNGIVLGGNIQSETASGSVIDNVTVMNNGEHGLWIRNASCCKINVISVFNKGNGIYIFSDVPAWEANENTIIANVTGNSGHGVEIEQASTNKIIEVVSQGNGGYGLKIKATHNIIYGYTENNVLGSMSIESFGNYIIAKMNEGRPAYAHQNNLVIEQLPSETYYKIFGNAVYSTSWIAAKYLAGTNIEPNETHEFTIDGLVGASIGDFVDYSVSSIPKGIIINACITSDATCTITQTNVTNTTINTGGQSWKVIYRKID